MIAPPPIPVSPVLQPVHVHHSGVPLEVVRREHLAHENGLKSLGTLHLLGGGICVLATVIFFSSLVFSLLEGRPLTFEKPEEWITIVMVPVMAVIHLQIGLGLRRLNAKVRTGAIIVACLGLLAFPLGTIINGVILSYLVSKKGTFVLTEEYRGIIAQTPHVKPKTSVAAVIVLSALLAILVALVATMAILAAR